MASSGSELEIDSIEFKKKIKKYKCKHCDSTFTRKRNRNQHELGHTEKNFQCTTCSKTFQYPYQLKRHEKVHAGYKCSECEYKANKFSDLVKHRKSEHKKKRPCEMDQECPYCSQIIKTKAALRTHIEKLHFDEGDVYECGECGRQYKYKQNLKQHYLSVHKKVEYKCNHCKRSFGSRTTLRRHLKNKNLKCASEEAELIKKRNAEVELLEENTKEIRVIEEII